MGEAESGVTFLDFASEHGLIIDQLIEGRWARVKTTDKAKKRNGSYKFMGEVGFVQNHATMEKVAVWHPDGKVEKIDRDCMRQMMAKNAAQERQRQAVARELAEGMVKRASVMTHPYLTAKGFPKETGLVLEDELLIPMREFSLYKQLNSVQRISAQGEKKFLFGGKAGGSVFFIGPLLAHERWLVEGYATGLSVRAALRELHREAQVVVCFSASNLAHVGALVKPLRPAAFVAADNDASGAGEKAAMGTGLPWVMPTKVGDDCNDLHQREGVGALVKLIRTVRARAAEAA